jgi:hypothetical protein
MNEHPKTNIDLDPQMRLFLKAANRNLTIWSIVTALLSALAMFAIHFLLS